MNFSAFNIGLVPLLATIGDAPAWIVWVGLLGGPAALVLTLAAYFKLDTRYERRDTATEKAETVSKTRAGEVEQLKAADARIEKLVEELSETIKNQDKSAQAAITSLRKDVNDGFLQLTQAINLGVLSLTKEVAIMQGRLAGASGVTKAE